MTFPAAGLLLLAVACRPDDEPVKTDSDGATDSDTTSLETADTGVRGDDDDDDDDTDDSDASATADTAAPQFIVASPPSPCLDAKPRSEAKFDRVVVGEDWDFKVGYQIPSNLGGAVGVATGDLDGDGDLDLVVPHHDNLHIMHNDGTGHFTEATATVMSEPVEHAILGSLVDIDADGDQDVVMASKRVVNLLTNDGGVLSAPQELPGSKQQCITALSWADVDQDGDLDVYVGRSGGGSVIFGTFDPCTSRLLRNDGGDWVVEEMTAVALNNAIPFAAGWVQLDGDPELELYSVSDWGPVLEGNLHVDNVGGTLVANETSELNREMAGMGLGVGDINEDGLADLFVPGLGENVLFISAWIGPTPVWFDQAEALGLKPNVTQRDQHSGWGGELFDANNDGNLDIVVNYGANRRQEGSDFHPRHTAEQPDELYLWNEQQGRFRKKGKEWGIDDWFANRGVVIADLDRNGWPDIIKRQWGGVVTVDLARCGENHWMGVRLHASDSTTNPDAIGARVVLKAGARQYTRWIMVGSTGMSSGSPPEAYFGVGDFASIDTIEVDWPTGEHTTYDVAHLGVDRYLDIYQDPL